eukprot:365122-Chlamydomonas_euryale.AAC.46
MATFSFVPITRYKLTIPNEPLLRCCCSRYLACPTRGSAGCCMAIAAISHAKFVSRRAKFAALLRPRRAARGKAWRAQPAAGDRGGQENSGAETRTQPALTRASAPESCQCTG